MTFLEFVDIQGSSLRSDRSSLRFFLPENCRSSEEAAETLVADPGKNDNTSSGWAFPLLDLSDINCVPL